MTKDNKPKHTPGPWRIDWQTNEDGPEILNPITSHGLAIIKALPYEDSSSENQEANAYLIAAAPTMLEMLKEAKLELEHAETIINNLRPDFTDITDREPYITICEAITKAEGGDS